MRGETCSQRNFTNRHWKRRRSYGYQRVSLKSLVYSTALTKFLWRTYTTPWNGSNQSEWFSGASVNGVVHRLHNNKMATPRVESLWTLVIYGQLPNHIKSIFVKNGRFLVTTHHKPSTLIWQWSWNEYLEHLHSISFQVCWWQRCQRLGDGILRMAQYRMIPQPAVWTTATKINYAANNILTFNLNGQYRDECICS